MSRTLTSGMASITTVGENIVTMMFNWKLKLLMNVLLPNTTENIGVSSIEVNDRTVLLFSRHVRLRRNVAVSL